MLLWPLHRALYGSDKLLVMDYDEQCAHLQDEIKRFADQLATAQSDTRVPTCPDWNVSELARHLGSIHRWAEFLVRHESERRVSLATLGLDESVPADSQWILDGGEALLSTLRSANPAAPMWSWGQDQHVRYWSRRQLHETAVHRCDLEIALGIDPELDPAVAADAIDEFLGNLAPSAAFSPSVRDLRGSGEALVFRATDVDRSWTAVLNRDSFTIQPGSSDAQAHLLGPASRLALLLYRRVGLADSGVITNGSDDLIRFWLDHSGLE
jgi:uncharacterized protein (TIGR03083 family)